MRDSPEGDGNTNREKDPRDRTQNFSWFNIIAPM